MPRAQQISATEAYRNFAEILRRVGQDREELVIQHYRKPVVRLTSASASPSRWWDLNKAARGGRGPDRYLQGDLAALRGRRSVPGSRRQLRLKSTVMLDTSILVALPYDTGIHPLQRVAICSASIAEIMACASFRGPSFVGRRMRFAQHIARAVPCLAFNVIVATHYRLRPPEKMWFGDAVVRPGGLDSRADAPDPHPWLAPMIAATAAAMDWPVVTRDPTAYEGLDLRVLRG